MNETNMTNSFRSLLLFSAVSLSFLLTVTVVEAETVVRSGEEVSIAEDQVIEGDFYSVAGKVNVSGSVEEDLTAVAGKITVNGSVGDNAFLLAGQTDIHGVIGDDLRIISGETTIAEPVMGDVLVLGGTVSILSTASVSGDVILYAGEATVEGSVGGDILGTVGNLRVDALVAGDMDVTVEHLTLGGRANVSGSVRYVSNELVVQSLNATVVGGMVRSDPVIPGSQPNVQAALIPVLILLFSVLTWYLASRKTLDLVVERALTRSPRALFLGILVMFFTPIIFILLLISVIGSLAGTVVAFAYLLLVTLSFVGMVAVSGQLLMFIFNQPAKQTTILSLIVGVVSVGLLMLLPVIGQIAVFILVLITLGAMADIIYRPTIEK